MTTISGGCELVGRGRIIVHEMGTYLAVENVFVALAFHLHLNVGSIGRGDLGFSHKEGRANLSFQQRIKPLSLLSLSAVFSEHFHVACIWGSTIHCLNSTRSAQTSQHRPEIRTSDATPLFPKYSAINPYSKLLKPAPSLKWFLGKNMFHMPSCFARTFKSSMT
jgi:hypothetical protein